MEPSAVARRSGSFEAHIVELPSFAASWLLGLGAASWTDVRYLWSSEDALFEEFIAETQHDHESLEALLNLWRRAVRLSESIVKASSAELVLERRSIFPSVGCQQGLRHSASLPPKKPPRLIVPWRQSAEPVRTPVSSASALLPRVADGVKAKCILLFCLLYKHVLDHEEIGFPGLNLEDTASVWEAACAVLPAALHCSAGHLGALAGGFKRWLKFAAEHSIPTGHPGPRQLAAFLRFVSLGGPTASSSLWQMFRWLKVHVNAAYPIEHFMVKPFRLHAPGHAQQQAEELQPWEFLNMLLCAANLTGCQRTMASFCVMSAASCIRFRHMQRSTLVRDHGAWLEFCCSMGKSRRQGVRAPYNWALPQVVLGRFNLLDEVRPVAVRQRDLGSGHLWPRPALESGKSLNTRLWRRLESSAVSNSWSSSGVFWHAVVCLRSLCVVWATIALGAFSLRGAPPSDSIIHVFRHLVHGQKQHRTTPDPAGPNVSA